MNKLSLAIIDTSLTPDTLIKYNNVRQIILSNSNYFEGDDSHCEIIFKTIENIIPSHIFKELNILIISILDNCLETNLSLVKKSIEIAMNEEVSAINFSVGLLGNRSKEYFNNLFNRKILNNTKLFCAYSIFESYPSHLKESYAVIDKKTYEEFNLNINKEYINEIIDLDKYPFIPISRPSFSVPVSVCSYILDNFKGVIS
jgi:hypothetical protein